MDVMILLIAFSLTVALGFLIAFIVTLRRGQYDDLSTPAMRILFDNDKTEKPASDRPATDQSDETGA